jgi:hypothetical protein
MNGRGNCLCGKDSVTELKERVGAPIEVAVE